MPDPATLDEYNFLQNARTRITGFGSDVTISTPCPFCCAPDVSVYKMLEVSDHMKQEHACNECGRSFGFIVDEAPGSTRFELVQTRGEPPPSFLPIRRKQGDLQ